MLEINTSERNMSAKSDDQIILDLLPIVETLATAMRSSNKRDEDYAIDDIYERNLLKSDYAPERAKKDLERIERLRSWPKVHAVLTYCIRAKRWVYEYLPEKWAEEYLPYIEAILIWMRKKEKRIRKKQAALNQDKQKGTKKTMPRRVATDEKAQEQFPFAAVNALVSLLPELEAPDVSNSVLIHLNRIVMENYETGLIDFNYRINRASKLLENIPKIRKSNWNQTREAFTLCQRHVGKSDYSPPEDVWRKFLPEVIALITRMGELAQER